MRSENGGATTDPRSLLRLLPAVEKVLEQEGLRPVIAGRGRGVVTRHIRATLDELRERILRRPPLPSPEDLTAPAVALAAIQHLQKEGQPLPKVINGTGVILHSGLGRAPLPACAAEAIARACGYALLEVDRDQGERRARDTRADVLLCSLSGAESALVVNNNAAATLLILNTLASGREVVCSRGELVEIGGSFRIPDVMEASGCRLVAVGTTNKTHLDDYARAITGQTAALLVVHTSNYRIIGFTSAPGLEEIAALAHRHGLPLIHDLGSGSLLSPEELGLGDEPPVGRSFEKGADVVCLSGDKLLGGPQAGIILGRREFVERMRKNPLARAIRIDKMTVAALEATLPLFLDKDRLQKQHPVVRMLTTPAEDLRPRAEALVAEVRREAPPGVKAEVVRVTSEAGSGALPTLQIPSLAAAISCPAGPDDLARRLRHCVPSVFTRIIDDRVCLDLRTLFPGEETEAAQLIINTLREISTP
jgi:L-seryl-tRNA(Ser) seleniumtransferase